MEPQHAPLPLPQNASARVVLLAENFYEDLARKSRLFQNPYMSSAVSYSKTKDWLMSDPVVRTNLSSAQKNALLSRVNNQMMEARMKTQNGDVTSKAVAVPESLPVPAPEKVELEKESTSPSPPANEVVAEESSPPEEGEAEEFVSPPEELPAAAEKSQPPEKAASSGSSKPPNELLGSVPYGDMSMENIVKIFPNQRNQKQDASAILSALRAGGKMWVSQDDKLIHLPSRKPVEGTKFTGLLSNLVMPGPTWFDPSQASTKSINDLIKVLKENPDFDSRVIRNEAAQHVLKGIDRVTRQE